MKRFLPHIILSLLVCLFIYLFYRTEKTLINQLSISLTSYESYAAIKTKILSAVPLSRPIIYSLPEGLWVFCITLTSRFFYLQVARFQLNLILVPLLIAVGLELLQLFHITNGRFDVVDILFALFFWLLALFLTRQYERKENILQTNTTAKLLCASSYAIVYLAHVTH